MRNTFIISAMIFVALSTSYSAFAMEISADNTGSIQEYRGNAQVVFNADESFEISSDSISKADGASIYSGNVIISFDEARIEADTVIMIKQKDGTSLLRSERLSLIAE